MLLKWYTHAVVFAIAILSFFFFVPRLFSQNSDVAVLIALAIIVAVPVVIGFYIKKFILGGKKEA